MDKDKKAAIFAGIFILVAYGILIGFFTTSKIAILIADVISGLAVIGIAVLLYPYLKSTNKPISTSYLILKYVEGILMVVGGVLFLFTSQQYTRDLIYDGIHLYAFIISAFMFYYLLFKSKLIPRFISVWGALGIFALSVSTLLKLINMSFPAIDYFLVLIITNEIFLAFWLMIRGFNKEVIN